MSDQIEQAKKLLKDNGYAILKEKSYRAAQERQHIAKVEKESAERHLASTERWARDCHKEERRLGERLSFLYMVAALHGASEEELSGRIDWPEDFNPPPKYTLIKKLDSKG